MHTGHWSLPHLPSAQACEAQAEHSIWTQSFHTEARSANQNSTCCQCRGCGEEVGKCLCTASPALHACTRWNFYFALCRSCASVLTAAQPQLFCSDRSRTLKVRGCACHLLTQHSPGSTQTTPSTGRASVLCTLSSCPPAMTTATHTALWHSGVNYLSREGTQSHLH